MEGGGGDAAALAAGDAACTAAAMIAAHRNRPGSHPRDSCLDLCTTALI
jgi:hypothetical protein